MKQFLLIAFILMPAILIAQSTNPVQNIIEWDYNSVLNGTNNELVSITGNIVTYPNQKIDWVQAGGKTIQSFTIVKTTGAWTLIDADGSLQYDITYGDSSGTIKITKAGNSLQVDLALSNPGRKDIAYRFYIVKTKSLN